MGKYEMMCQTDRKIVDLSENSYFQGKKVLKERNPPHISIRIIILPIT